MFPICPLLDHTMATTTTTTTTKKKTSTMVVMVVVSVVVLTATSIIQMEDPLRVQCVPLDLPDLLELWHRIIQLGWVMVQLQQLPVEEKEETEMADPHFHLMIFIHQLTVVVRWMQKPMKLLIYHRQKNFKSLWENSVWNLLLPVITLK